MLKDIESNGKLFGVTLFDPQESFAEMPETGTVGCVAEIRESETLPDGRSNVLTYGLIRYRLVDYVEADEPYLIGNVEFFEDEKENAEELDPLSDEVFALFERMAKAAFKMSGNRGQLPEIQRADSEALSFLITAAFNFDNEKKYQMLEMTSTLQRLTELKEVLDGAVVRIEESADIHTFSITNGHSNKKIDL